MFRVDLNLFFIINLEFESAVNYSSKIRLIWLFCSKLQFSLTWTVLYYFKIPEFISTKVCDHFLNVSTFCKLFLFYMNSFWYQTLITVWQQMKIYLHTWTIKVFLSYLRDRELLVLILLSGWCSGFTPGYERGGSVDANRLAACLFLLSHSSWGACVLQPGSITFMWIQTCKPLRRLQPASQLGQN